MEQNTTCGCCTEYYEKHGHSRSGHCFGCEAKEATERDWETEAERSEYEGQF